MAYELCGQVTKIVKCVILLTCLHFNINKLQPVFQAEAFKCFGCLQQKQQQQQHS